MFAIHCPALRLLATGLLTLAATSAFADSATLKDAFKDHFYIGVAINRTIVSGPTRSGFISRRSADQVNQDIALVKEQFNQVSPENDLKWSLIQPRPGPDGYEFGPADAYVNFGLSNGMYIVGHTLVWHQQTPEWVFAGADSASRATRDELLQRMHEHIATVAGRYKGKIKVWDVVNEAVSDNGTNILRNSPWLQIIGPDFIDKAFQFAHEADPDAILRYNDYGLESSGKRHKLMTLIRSLRERGVPVMAIGTQTHVSVSSPSFEVEDQTLTDLETLGLPIHITELDVNGARSGQGGNGADVANNAGTTQGGMIDDANRRLAKEYAALFRAFVKHSKSVKVVTFWGVNDAVSWRAGGRPLLFDANDKPKPAFDAVIDEAKR